MKILYLTILIIIIIIIYYLCMKPVEVYFDNCATTKPDKKILKIYKYYFKNFYNISNRSNLHAKKIRNKFKNNINEIAKIFRINPEEIIITSGSSESNATAIKCISMALFKKYGTEPIIITSPTEHKSVIESCMCTECGKTIFLPVNKYGGINLSELEKTLKKHETVPTIVCLMGANNETGIIHPIKKIGDMCSKYPKCFFHSDMTQLFGKMREFHPKFYGIHSFSISLHKINGPKSTGMLFIDSKIPEIKSLIGGTQYNKKRGGTYNPAQAEIILYCIKKCQKDRHKKNLKLLKMRNLISQNFKKTLKKYNLPYYEFCHDTKSRLPHVLYISLPEIICSDKFIKFLNNIEKRKITKSNKPYYFIIGKGSACHEGEISHILKKIPIPEKHKKDTIRISLGDSNTLKECQRFIESLNIYLEELYKKQK